MKDAKALQTIQKHLDAVIGPKVQARLNQPPKDQTGFNEGHEDFLKTLIQKIEKGEINIYQPASLFNHSIYDKLAEEVQERTGLVAVNLLAIIRQIEQLWRIEKKATFQIQNLVETVWQMKARYEKECGDVFII